MMKVVQNIVLGTILLFMSTSAIAADLHLKGSYFEGTAHGYDAKIIKCSVIVYDYNTPSTTNSVKVDISIDGTKYSTKLNIGADGSLFGKVSGNYPRPRSIKITYEYINIVIIEGFLDQTCIFQSSEVL
jgi:hypothetical protein